MGKVFAGYGSCLTLYDLFSAGLGNCNRTRTHNHLIQKQTLNHLTKLEFPIFLQDQSQFKSYLNY